MDTSPHKSDFVNVNGVRLHYLDWGGSGPALLFLPGLGCNAHIFNEFAPRFRDAFHILALTRRGHGDSDYPETGYDIDTLTEDIRQFLDCLGIDRVILAGHSYAGRELSHFSALHPERVLKLVFLDAAYDTSLPEYKAVQEKNPFKSIQIPLADEDHYSVQSLTDFLKFAYPRLAEIWGNLMAEHLLHDIRTEPDGKVVDKMSDAIGAALSASGDAYVPENAKIKAPVLNFYAVRENTYHVAPAYMTLEQQVQVMEFYDLYQGPWNRRSMEKFQQDVPHATTVKIPMGHHYCFIKHADLVFDEMRKFLLDGRPGPERPGQRNISD